MDPTLFHYACSRSPLLKCTQCPFRAEVESVSKCFTAIEVVRLHFNHSQSKGACPETVSLMKKKSSSTELLLNKNLLKSSHACLRFSPPPVSLGKVFLDSRSEFFFNHPHVIATGLVYAVAATHTALMIGH